VLPQFCCMVAWYSKQLFLLYLRYGSTLYRLHEYELSRYHTNVGGRKNATFFFLSSNLPVLQTFHSLSVLWVFCFAIVGRGGLSCFKCLNTHSFGVLTSAKQGVF
jgi:hypothetical protein